MDKKTEAEMKTEQEPVLCTAVLLAAGSGKRMQSATAKQFMLLQGKPLLWYALHTIENSPVLTDCILVTGRQDIPYVQQEIVKKYGFTKVSAVIAGGEERYASVSNAMEYIRQNPQRGQLPDYLFIHDGARPFLTEKILQDTYAAAAEYGACVAAVPSKDTVKIADAQGFVASTPDRRRIWNVQTPQVFRTELIMEAYRKLKENPLPVTDDASVVELFTGQPVKLVMGDYENLKITTPEDIQTAEGFLRKKTELKSC